MKYIFIFISFLFIGCSSIPSLQQRVKNAEHLFENDKSIKKDRINTSSFNLYLLREIESCKTIRVYIEGDGLAWISKKKVSLTPTPINPLSMKLFLKDESLCKIYLARPCQYLSSNKCEKKFWTSHRYSKEVIDSYLEAFSKIKEKYKNNNFEIIGFSGGGTVATLISSFRDDIYFLITIAGNLDHKYWSKKHNITPLEGSLNPIDYIKRLEKVQQLHLIGGRDRIIDESIFNSYFSYFKDSSKIRKKLFKEFSHQKGWEENWKSILNSKEFF